MDVRVGLVKKAEHRRTHAFKLWCWRRLLRVPWTATRSNQSILKENSPKYSLEGLMLKPKPRYFGHLMQKAGSSEKTPILGKTEGRRKRGWQRRRWLDGITNSPGDGEGQGGKPGVLHSMMLQRVRHDWVTELQPVSYKVYYRWIATWRGKKFLGN